jgi:hypothetical protein
MVFVLFIPKLHIIFSLLSSTLNSVLLPVSLTDARCSFVYAHVSWPSVSAAAASCLAIDPHIVVLLIRSAHTLRGLCISALWLLEKLFNYWELLRRGVTATRKRFLRMIGCSELLLSQNRLITLSMSASMKLNVSRVYCGASVDAYPTGCAKM